MVVMGSAPKPEELVQQMKQVIGMWSELEELERLSSVAAAKSADTEEVVCNRIRRCEGDLHRTLSDLARCKGKLALEGEDAVSELQAQSGMEAALSQLETFAARVAQDVAAVTAALVSGDVTVLKKGECKSVQEVLASVAEAEQALQGCEQAALLRLTNLLENLCVEVTDLQAERLSADRTIHELKEKNSVLVDQMQQSGLDVKVEAASVGGADGASGERRGTAMFGVQSRGSLDQSSILGSELGRYRRWPPCPQAPGAMAPGESAEHLCLPVPATLLPGEPHLRRCPGSRARSESTTACGPPAHAASGGLMQPRCRHPGRVTRRCRGPGLLRGRRRRRGGSGR
mmetsp:Transcript_58869/g.133119  ORF Transcript_58869/g.133119 Transcript_58869/m.133119 type:complete len:344 (-) Transcript_58869:445-1476(-)